MIANSWQSSQARSELAIKKREEKDLRYSEKQHLDQILSLEADVARAEKQLERTRELHAALKHDFEDQSAEAERLRLLVQELREVSLPFRWLRIRTDSR